MIRIRLLTFLLTGAACGLAACDSETPLDGIVIPAPTTAAEEPYQGVGPGMGIWSTEPDGWFGTSLLLLVNDRNEYQIIERPFGIQGVGFLQYDDNSTFTSSYWAYEPLESPPHGWDWWSPVCEFSYGLELDDQNRDVLVGWHECEFFGTSASYRDATRVEYSEMLVRSPASDVATDIGIFAGTWTSASEPGNDVLNIDSRGVITGQDSTGGCFYSGQIQEITPADDRGIDGIYDLWWTFHGCSAGADNLNDVPFTGTVFSEDNAGEKSLTIIAIGTVGEHEVSLYLEFIAY